MGHGGPWGSRDTPVLPVIAADYCRKQLGRPVSTPEEFEQHYGDLDKTDDTFYIALSYFWLDTGKIKYPE